MRSPSKYVIWLRVDTFHLIKDNTFVSDVFRRMIELIVPTLLLKSLNIVDTVRKENSIEIDIDEIIKILVISGGNGVTGPIRICECIEESVQASFQQFNKWFFERIFSGSTQYTVL